METLTTSTTVTYTVITNQLLLLQTLQDIAKTYPIIACDFETASKYTDEEKERLKLKLAALPPNSLAYHKTNQAILSSGISHPPLVRMTHCSIATSETTAYVIIFTDTRMRDITLNWLVTTPIKQVWHNASFDLKHVYYHTQKFPKDFEDSQILAKTLLNDVDNQKSLVGLKHLMGYKYGAWAVSADDFNQSQMYEEHVLHYAAIDACATFALWNELQNYIQE